MWCCHHERHNSTDYTRCEHITVTTRLCTTEAVLYPYHWTALITALLCAALQVDEWYESLVCKWQRFSNRNKKTKPKKNFELKCLNRKVINATMRDMTVLEKHRDNAQNSRREEKLWQNNMWNGS